MQTTTEHVNIRKSEKQNGPSTSHTPTKIQLLFKYNHCDLSAVRQKDILKKYAKNELIRERRLIFKTYTTESIYEILA